MIISYIIPLLNKEVINLKVCTNKPKSNQLMFEIDFIKFREYIGPRAFTCFINNLYEFISDYNIDCKGVKNICIYRKSNDIIEIYTNDGIKFIKSDIKRYIKCECSKIQ